ncbi:MAG: histidine kinase [Pseudomonadota bacterium]|nr:histidine kinase [Pseudomonadota bacterium]
MNKTANMSPNLGSSERVYEDNDVSFWFLQLSGWFALALISFFSLTVWYNRDELTLGYIFHPLVQSAIGVVVSYPMRPLSNFAWRLPFWTRLTRISLGIVVFATIWTSLRLWTFMLITPEQNLWSDFGGWLFTSILIFIAWAAIYHGINYYQLLESERSNLLSILAANKEEQLKRAKAESMAHEAQLKMLRYQLNPHFLFNTLNSISSLVNKRDDSRANEMILQLSDFLRHSLYIDPVEGITLKEELDALQLYLRIEQARFGDRLSIHLDVSSEAEQLHVPSMILQPLVENAIKYAIAPCEEGGEIKVSAGLYKDDMIAIRVTDNGPGFDENVIDESSVGVGLRNTRERLNTFYRGNSRFLIDSNEKNGTTISIIVPRTNQEDS